MAQSIARKPAVGFDDIIQRGHKALILTRANRPPVEARTGPGVIDGLAADLARLGVDTAEVKEKKAQALAATVGQNDALANAAAIVTAIRTALRKRSPKPPAETLKGYGVGTRMDPKVVSSVTASGSVICERAKARPQEARELGIIDSDIGTLGGFLERLQKADAAQESVIAARPVTTAERNRTAKRILEAVRAISGAGVLAFALNPELRAQFDALDDLPAARKPAKKTPVA